jgi:glutaredoxin 3
MNAIIYSKNGCGFCTQAKRLLESKGIKYQEFNMTLQPEKRDELLEAAASINIVPRSVPQIWMNNKYIGGYDQLKLFFASE